MVGHAGAAAGARWARGGGGGGGGIDRAWASESHASTKDKVFDALLKQALRMDDPLVMLTSAQSVTKLVTDQGTVYAEICRLADTCQLDLSSVGKKLKHPGANVKESARIALENMDLLNESAIRALNEIASKHGPSIIGSAMMPPGRAASSLTAVDCLRSLDVSLAALSENIILLGTAIFAVRDAKGDPDWHEHRPAPADGNDRVLALASIMNQRRLIRNHGKAIILQEGGSAKLARTKFDRQDSLHYERVILTAKPMKTSCVLL